MKLLVIGQTPPPYGGQSINIGRMLAVFDNKQIPYKLLRMNFSEEMNENGKFSYKKLVKLFHLMFSTIKAILFYRPDYVYYPPAGPEKIPVYRDIIVLFFVRLFNKKVVFHFHAGGLSDIYPKLPGLVKRLFRFVFFKPEYAICLSKAGMKDPEFLGCNQIAVIPSGVEDVKRHADSSIDQTFTVLFVGVCRETKGILDFLQIIAIANSKNKNIIGRVVGRAFSEKEELAIQKMVELGVIRYDGIKTGEDKNRIFSESNLFLFPTFFEHENFPTVILEAFSAGMPVIATNWRGVKDQVINDYNGYLYEVHDTEGMAQAILKLAGDKELYLKLSANARSDFENTYTIEKFEENITNFFTQLK